MEDVLHPFVKWAGGKTQLIERLYSRFPETFRNYYEPFVGSGALLLSAQPKRAVINDVNGQLINVYRQLKENADAVIERIQEYDAAECDKDFYLAMRARYNEKIVASSMDAECAALTIWINKHCFNGLYRVNAKGLFNVPYNNKTGGSSMDAYNLRRIGAYLRENDIEIRNEDFETAVRDVRAGDFVYFDSPYVPVSETANFTDYTKDGFSPGDHERLAVLAGKLDKAGAFIMLSNHDVPLVHELYAGFRIEETDVRRSINRNAAKRRGKEVIIRNY